MKRLLSTAALALLTITAVPGDAQAHGRVRFGIGIGFGFPIYPAYPYYPAYPVYPAYAYPAPAPEAYQPVPSASPSKAPPDPIFYPRSGQDGSQTEADRQACNRWATTQPNALADASVFHRATLACMEGRGYVVR